MPDRIKPTLGLCLAAVSLLFSIGPLAAQTAPSSTATPSASAAQIPLAHLYLHFFLYEAHLEHLAEQHSLQTFNGKPLKDQMRKASGLTESEWQTISTASLSMEATHKDLSAQAKTLENADRQACLSSPTACKPPPSLNQLIGIHNQHQQALQRNIQTVESTLGASSTAKLQAYLQSEIASHIRLATLTPAQVQAANQAAAKAVAR